jgi:hypothetical protein
LRRGIAAWSALVVALAVSASPAWPDAVSSASARPWRLLFGASFVDASLATSYGTSYTPPLASVPHAGTASQALPLDAGHTLGLQLGLERALGAHLALQLTAEHASADVTGDPGRYDIRLVYTSRPPPSNEPVAVELRRDEARPAAVGELSTWAAALNLAAWLDAGSHARLGVSAGPAWLHAAGQAQSLVYTSYTLGGHSVLFSDDHLVSFEFPASTLGLDLGAFLEAELGARVALRADARYFWGPEQDAGVALREVVNPGEIVQAVDLAQIQAGLAPSPVRLDPSFFRAALSLVVRF